MTLQAITPKAPVGLKVARLLGLAAVLLAVVAARAQGPADAGRPGPAQGEAYYKGKPTSFWIKKLQDKDAAARREAVQALEAIGPEAEAAVPALLQALQDEDTAVRVGTLKAFGQIGPGAKAAVPALLHALKDKDP